MFNVSLPVHLTFKEALRNAETNTSTTGAVTLSRDWPIFITKIDPGPEHAFLFYAYNQSSKFVEVALPDFVQVQVGEGRRTMPLTKPEHLKRIPAFLEPTERP